MNSSSSLRLRNLRQSSIITLNGTVGHKKRLLTGCSIVAVAVLAFAAWQGRIEANLYGGVMQLGPWRLHPLVLLFGVSGTLMVSKTLRIPKL